MWLSPHTTALVRGHPLAMAQNDNVDGNIECIVLVAGLNMDCDGSDS